MKSKKGLGCVGIFILLICVGLLITYWYIFATIAVVICGIWLYRRRKNNRESASLAPNPVEDPLKSSKEASNEPVIVKPVIHEVPNLEPVHPEPVHPEPVISRIRRSLHDFVVFDIETTGLNASSDEIIQLSAIKVHDDEVVDTFDRYLKPQRKIPEKIVYLTGITNELVEDASPIDEIMPQFVKFTADFPLVGHNIIKFDLPFILRNGFYREKIEALDTLILARKTDFPDSISNFKLPTLKQYFGITNTSHNAIEDCKTNMVVYQRIRDGKLESTPAPIVKPTLELAKLRFAITGEFIGMSRDEITALITMHGGRVTQSISKMTDFLVDGTQISDVLTDGTHSHKELVAKEIQQEGGKISIIGLDDLKSMIYNH